MTFILTLVEVKIYIYEKSDNIDDLIALFKMNVSGFTLITDGETTFQIVLNSIIDD